MKTTNMGFKTENLKKLIFLVFVMMILFDLFSSCKKETLSVPQFPASKEVLKNIMISQIAYDSLRFEQSATLKLSRQVVQRITIFQWNQYDFQEVGSIVPNYILYDGKFIPQFSLTIHAPEDLFIFKGWIRYTLSDSSFIDLDTSFVLCKYPFESAEVFWLKDDLPYPKTKRWHIDDFDFEGQRFFYRSGGGYGVYEVNFITGESKVWIDAVSHNLIAVDDRHLFYTISNHEIQHMDLNSGQFRDVKTFSWRTELNGLEASNDTLYALDYIYGVIYLLDYDGNVLDSIKTRIAGSGLTKFKESLIFSSREGLHALNLRTHQVTLINPKRPYSYIIRIHGNYLYYYDYDKCFIGRIPLQAIFQSM